MHRRATEYAQTSKKHATKHAQAGNKACTNLWVAEGLPATSVAVTSTWNSPSEAGAVTLISSYNGAPLPTPSPEAPAAWQASTLLPLLLLTTAQHNEQLPTYASPPQAASTVKYRWAMNAEPERATDRTGGVVSTVQ